MRSIFLSASVPVKGRGEFYETANPFLIQFAVREFLTVCLGRRHIVWGGHPAITPMVWSVCEDLGIDYSAAITLYQSRKFEEDFPQENRHFKNVEFVEAVNDDREKSLRLLRERMLNRPFEAAVFIGGMEGVLIEYEMFLEAHPDARIVTVSSPGGASMQLAKKLGRVEDRIDFARFFQNELQIDSREPRKQL